MGAFAAPTVAFSLACILMRTTSLRESASASVYILGVLEASSHHYCSVARSFSSTLVILTLPFHVTSPISRSPILAISLSKLNRAPPEASCTQSVCARSSSPSSSPRLTSPCKLSTPTMPAPVSTLHNRTFHHHPKHPNASPESLKLNRQVYNIHNRQHLNKPLFKRHK